MPKYTTAADRIADGLFAAKNRMFEFIQQKLDEGNSEQEIMKELKETVTADPLMLAEIEQTFFKKKAKKVAFVPQIIFSDLLHDINSLWEDGYITQAELNTILEKYGELEEDIMHFALDETKASNIFDNFVGPFLTIAEEREEITEQANTGLITEQEKKDMLTRDSTTKKVSFNPYRAKKAVDVTELFKEYDAIMDAATDMRTEGIISDEEYTSIDKAHKSIDDPAHIVSYLEELKELMEKAMATSKAASWIDDAKVGDKVELNDETGEVVYIGNDKIEVKTPTKTETIWKN